MRVVYKEKGLQMVTLAFYPSKLDVSVSSIGDVRFVEGDPCIRVSSDDLYSVSFHFFAGTR